MIISTAAKAAASVLAAAALLAPAARADCPTSPDDLDPGITIVFDDTSVTRLSRDPDGMIVDRTDYTTETGRASSPALTSASPTSTRPTRRTERSSPKRA